MSPIPPFVVELRELIGHRQLWLPAVTAVVLREEEVLLTRRADNGRWAPITGLLDPGEHPAVGAVREAEEEASVVVRAERLADGADHVDVGDPRVVADRVGGGLHQRHGAGVRQHVRVGEGAVAARGGDPQRGQTGQRRLAGAQQ